jgi:hypothetical protein
VYASPNIVRVIKTRRMRWAENLARTGALINSYRILVGKPEGKRHRGRPTCRWEGNIRMNVRELGWGGVNWICLDQDRDWCRAVVNIILNLCVIYKAGTFLPS